MRTLVGKIQQAGFRIDDFEYSKEGLTQEEQVRERYNFCSSLENECLFLEKYLYYLQQTPRNRSGQSWRTGAGEISNADLWYFIYLIGNNRKSLQNVIKTTASIEEKILTLKDEIKDEIKEEIKDILDMSSKQKTNDTIEYLKKLIDYQTKLIVKQETQIDIINQKLEDYQRKFEVLVPAWKNKE